MGSGDVYKRQGKAPRSRFSFRVRACHSFVNLHDGELPFRLEARLSYSPSLLIPGPGRLAFATEIIKKTTARDSEKI